MSNPVRNMNRAIPFKVDRRENPTYTVGQAAAFVGVPESTLHAWVFGRPYVTRSGTQRFQPIIQAADEKTGNLSFYNLVEAHILSSTRQNRNIRMDRIRRAIDYVREKWPAEQDHPLLTRNFYEDGKDLFVKTLEDEVINASRGGQVALSAIVKDHLELIERDVAGLPTKLYPRSGERIVVLNPAVSSGRPTVRGTGMLVSLLSQRIDAGENIESIARNYGVDVAEIQTAVKYFKAA